MSNETSPNQVPRLSIFRNWLTMVGLVIVIASLFAFFFLLSIDAFAHVSNPYIGILNFFVTPAFTMLGLAFAAVGAILRRRRMGKQVGIAPTLAIDLGRPRDRKVLAYFLAGSAAFLLITAIGTYHSYHFTESVTFCGQACHTVMEPEMVAYQHGSHARVACAECHIGRGATWYVRSKLSGTYQVYATFASKYPRPIPTPIANLRPAQETCEQCHWPKKFVGNLEKTFSHFLSEETNNLHEIRMILKVGGADPSHGPQGGIHWHMNVANKIEYYPADESRQKIPFVRMTDAQGVVSEYRTKEFTNAVDLAALRRMDCMDCHNRPAHLLGAPNDSVDLALKIGAISTALPYIKTNAVYILTRTYTNATEAVEKIATYLSEKYPKNDAIRPAIATVQQIYRENFFPEMKATWRAYPNNIGHKDWPGCFRCHDGNHRSTDGKRDIKANDCNACHLIIAQGSGSDLEQLSPKGLAFKHPGDELEKGMLCNDCHTGGP